MHTIQPTQGPFCSLPAPADAGNFILLLMIGGRMPIVFSSSTFGAAPESGLVIGIVSPPPKPPPALVTAPGARLRGWVTVSSSLKPGSPAS